MLKPDVVVLTEYVEGPTHSSFCTALEAGGLTTRFTTPVRAGHNQVLVASRSIGTLVTFIPPYALPHAASNCLYVRFADPPLDLLGVRIPWYKRAIDSRSHWDWFETAIQPLIDSRIVIIGDLNADPRRLKGRGLTNLQRLEATGWVLPDPQGAGSYISAKGKTSRLDHALVSPAVVVGSAEYVASENGCRFMGQGSAYLSDHAPLVLNVTVPR